MKGVTWLNWNKPSVSRIYEIVTHPAVAGYDVYGRHLHAPAPEGGRLQAIWDTGIVVPGHHEAYCAPADWHRLQERLRQNNFTRGAKVTKRKGTSLSENKVSHTIWGLTSGFS